MTTFELKLTGPIALSGTLQIGQPEPSQRYLRVAQVLAAGIHPLVQAGPSCGVALAFLAAQVAETALKAFLLKHYSPKALAQSQDRHHIDALWSLAKSHGLALEPAPADALQLLVGLHRKPYPLRYSDEKDTRLLFLPDSGALAAEVEDLLGIVTSAM